MSDADGRALMASTVLPSVSVCFPAYNEEETIEAVLEDAYALLAHSGIAYEILVCDDGSTDRTGRIIDETIRQIPEARLIRHERNLGIRQTFEDLYAEASNEYVFLNSTDRQWDTRVLLELLPLTRDWDIIVASRRDKHYGPGRRFTSWGFNRILRVVFGVAISDAGAVKLVRREIITRFPLLSQSPFSEAERLARAQRAGYRITEVVVDVAPRRTGRARGASLRLVLGSLADAARVWWSLHARREPVRGTAR
jgi:glycosyltransferase involved in cell wall biosynthesis